MTTVVRNGFRCVPICSDRHPLKNNACLLTCVLKTATMRMYGRRALVHFWTAGPEGRALCGIRHQAEDKAKHPFPSKGTNMLLTTKIKLNVTKQDAATLEFMQGKCRGRAL